MTRTATPAQAPDYVTSSPGLPTVFRAVTRSEWTKLRTVRSTIWALVFTVISIIGLGVLLTALEVSRWAHRTVTEVTGFDPLLYAFGGLPLAQLSVGVLGVLVMTSEYAKGAIRVTFAATPQRPLLLTAKVATFSAVIAAVSLASCLCAFFVCEAILGPTRGGVSITDPGVLRAFLQVRGLQTPGFAASEVDRYLGLPGQAICYKVGERHGSDGCGPIGRIAADIALDGRFRGWLM